MTDQQREYVLTGTVEDYPIDAWIVVDDVTGKVLSVRPEPEHPLTGEGPRVAVTIEVVNVEPTVYDTTPRPAEEWVRSIEFVDLAAEDGERAPIHVTQRVLINGRATGAGDGEIPLRMSRTHPVLVTNPRGIGNSETLVSFVCLAADLVEPDYDQTPGSPSDSPVRVGGLQALIPTATEGGGAYRWAHVEHLVENDTHPEADGYRWVRVWLQVAEVKFTAVRAEARSHLPPALAEDWPALTSLIDSEVEQRGRRRVTPIKVTHHTERGEWVTGSEDPITMLAAEYQTVAR